MPQLRIEHRTERKKEDIWQWVEEHIERELCAKVPREEFKVIESARDCAFTVQGKNVVAQVQVSDNLLAIELKIPLLFVPFQSRIEAGIRSALQAL